MSFDFQRSCKDIDSLNYFIKSHFKFCWSKQQLVNHLSDPHSVNYFCYLSGKTVGYILFNLNPLTRQAHLYQVCVGPSNRGLSLASQLMQKSLLEMKGRVDSVFLEVETSNKVAIEFYVKLGFIKLNKINSFYSDGSDAFAMHLSSSKLARLHLN